MRCMSYYVLLSNKYICSSKKTKIIIRYMYIYTQYARLFALGR